MRHGANCGRIVLPLGKRSLKAYDIKRLRARVRPSASGKGVAANAFGQAIGNSLTGQTQMSYRQEFDRARGASPLLAANGEMGPLVEASSEDRAFNNNVADEFYYQQMAMRESYDVPIPLSPDLLVRENEIPIVSSDEPVIVVEDGKVSYANRDGVFEVTSTRPHDSIPTQMGRLFRESQFSYNGNFVNDAAASVSNTLISPITAGIVAAKLADDFVERITGYSATEWLAPFAVGNELALLGEVASLAKAGRAANISAKVPFRIADDVPDANHGGNLLPEVPNSAANPNVSGPIFNPAGKVRAEKFADFQQGVSLRGTVDLIAGDSSVVTYTNSGKTLYTNPATGKQVVYDNAGNYFRVEDTTVTGPLRYTDQFGKPIPNNVPLIKPNGVSQTGIPSDVRKALTHFTNTD